MGMGRLGVAPDNAVPQSEDSPFVVEGDLTISGGTVSVTDRSGGAGISGNAGGVTISGRTVNATGGSGALAPNTWGGASGVITITSSVNVTARGDDSSEGGAVSSAGEVMGITMTLPSR